MKRYSFIIGAQRSGTTFLLQNLDAHPGISSARPIRPEPKYLLRPDPEINVDDYEARYFRDVPSSVLRSEKSASYIEYPDVARRILRFFPASRCMAVLRDPVERAISNYWFSVINGFEKRPPDEALDPEAEDNAIVPGVSASPFAYLKRGCYLEQLEKYIDILGSGELLVLQTEQLVSNGFNWQRVWEFLKVEDFSPPPIEERPNNLLRERDIRASTRQRLKEYFQPRNEALAQRFKLDLPLWRA